MISMAHMFWSWLEKLPVLDFADLLIFVTGTMVYKIF